jgi:hypothetical protein
MKQASGSYGWTEIPAVDVQPCKVFSIPVLTSHTIFTLNADILPIPFSLLSLQTSHS